MEENEAYKQGQKDTYELLFQGFSYLLETKPKEQLDIVVNKTARQVIEADINLVKGLAKEFGIEL